MYMVLYQQLAKFIPRRLKVPETKKVVDGVLLVRRGGLMMYTVLYQQPVR